ncbi:MAG: type II toxin-antitoxin system RelE/ParE family toxin [Actinomycetota bacterium]|nr:type II toxin-antitoxin system RelE/ParE family toxin [Actinomycetota bacterium]MDQ2956228.1 type II toxin-antitoxin system RelE/ParE family toxin [Actinomycetota bacterium]
MSSQQPYELIVAPPAQRAIAGKLPEAVAVAVIDFLTTALIENPQRVGKQLRDDLAGIWSARRGTYRVLYRINNEKHEVIVLRIEHRGDVYRPGSFT